MIGGEIADAEPVDWTLHSRRSLPVGRDRVRAGPGLPSRQEEDNRTRFLMILDGQYFLGGSCTDRPPPPTDGFQIVIGHVTDASKARPEVYYYRTAAHGRLIKAVRVRSAQSPPALSVDAADARVLADFAAEKNFWLARYGLR
jgi:hypothetical protein